MKALSLMLGLALPLSNVLCAQEAATSGESKVITNSVGMTLILIPSGDFTMGSPLSEVGRNSDEGPQHQVTISKEFYLAANEVTQAQYEEVVGVNPSTENRGEKYPVAMVSWDDAVKFCERLSAKEGRSYRLPTEAEWEYACRAGTTTRHPWGDSDDESTVKQYCWYRQNADESYWTVPHADREGPQTVGSLKPNRWGLHDMHGNVWEWCADWYGDYPNGHVSDPTGPSSGVGRVLRGGHWESTVRLCRSADRLGTHPSETSDTLGFRVVLVP